MAAVDREGLEKERTISWHGIGAMLPLHYPRRTLRYCRIGSRAVVGFFVVAIAGEGVGEARKRGFDEAIFYGVVEALENVL